MGIASRGPTAAALIDYAFTELNLNRIEADTDPRNERSARVLDRLKFSKEGFFRERCIVDGGISDAAMYDLLRRDGIKSHSTLSTKA